MQSQAGQHQNQDGPSADEVGQAVAALYNSPPEQQQAASQWLNSFAEHPAAPTTVLALLEPGVQAEIQFFCTNLLLNAVRRKWSRLDAAVQERVKQKISEELGSSPGKHFLPWLVRQRLVLVYAVIAAASGLEAILGLISHALALGNNGSVTQDEMLLLALELLSAVAEQANNLQRKSRADLLAVLPQQADRVFHFVNSALTHPQGTNSQKRSALHCLLAWVQVDASETSTGLVSPGALLASQRQLFEALTTSVASSDPDIADAAKDILVSLLGCWSRGGDHGAEDAAVKSIARALLAAREQAGSGGLAEHTQSALIQVAAALACRDTQAIAGDTEEAVPLAALVLEGLRSGHRSVAESAIEYFDVLNAVPVAQRHPQLGPPVYTSMLPSLAALARYPADFTTCEECVDDDSEAFHSFRDHVLSDALDTCQKLLQQAYLSYFLELHTADSWQAQEAALFAIRQFNRKGAAGKLTAEADASFRALFLQLYRGGQGATPPQQHPLVMDAAAHLIAAQAAWLATCDDPWTVENSFVYLMRALQSPLAAGSAAAAFCALCLRCTADRSASLLPSLLPAVTSSLQSTGPDAPSWEQKGEVVEGIAGLMRLLPAQASLHYAQQLATSLVEQCSILASQAPGASVEVAANLAGAIQQLATLIRCLEFSSSASGEQPAAPVIQTTLPLLERVAASETWRADAAIVAAVCEVYKRVLQALGKSAEAMLGQVVAALGTMFSAEPSGCMEVLTAAVDLARDAPAVQQPLGATVGTICNSLLPALQGDSFDPDVATALFGLLAHCLVDDAAGKMEALALQVKPLLPSLVGFAVSCLQRQEADLVRASLAFLRNALGLDVQNKANAIQQCLEAQGPALLRDLLRAAAVTCPQRLLRSLASLLHALLNHAVYAGTVREWFGQAMGADEVLEGQLELSDRQLICQIALQMPPAMAGSFAALIRDMASIARAEATSDILLSYEM